MTPEEARGNPRDSRSRALVRLLAKRVAATDQPLDGEVSVAELRRRLIPYEVARADLGLAAKAEYDVAFLEMLASGEYLEAEDRALAEAVRKELDSAEPALAFLQDYAASHLRLDLEEIAKELWGSAETGGGKGFAPGRPTAARGDEAEAGDREGGQGDEAEAEAAAEAAAEAGGEDAAGEGSSTAAEGSGTPAEGSGVPASGGGGGGRSCWSCGREPPPVAAEERYCVWCGSDLKIRPCDSCDRELRVEWSFCPACGTEMTS